MSVIKLKITVEEIANVLQNFDQIKVYRSTTGYGGTYSEISIPPLARISMQQGQDRYEFDDPAGAPTYWYRVSYLNSLTAAESDRSEPQLGEDQSADGVISVQEVKDLFLFGVDLTNDAGEPFPDLMFSWGIRQAIGFLERRLDIRIKKTVLTGERYDYYRQDYQNWMIIRLREAPVISVEAVRIKWPSNVTVLEFPDEWIQLRKDAGQINIVPTSGTFSQVLLTAGGSFLPLLASGQDFVPNILEVDFTAGFADGAVPIEIRDCVGKLASFGPLNIAGDLIAGAGIASKSISVDGLSQSINTTSSATNAGYGSRLIQYNKELQRVIPTLEKYYKGIRLTGA